jgi:SAM-dependent methyltransferase
MTAPTLDPPSGAALVPASVQCPGRMYAEGLRAAGAGRPHGLRVREAGGASRPLPLPAWTARHRAGDHGLLARCRIGTVDVGCGPGRLVAALSARGVAALGVDTSEEAVAQTRARGGRAVHRSVFAGLPDEGTWNTVLLADGNIGIGGDPPALLRRCRSLLRSGGQVLAELDGPGRTRRIRLRLESGDRHSAWFSWAHVGVDAASEVAGAAGLTVRGLWHDARRWFAVLEA